MADTVAKTRACLQKRIEIFERTVAELNCFDAAAAPHLAVLREELLRTLEFARTGFFDHMDRTLAADGTVPEQAARHFRERAVIVFDNGSVGLINTGLAMLADRAVETRPETGVGPPRPPATERSESKDRVFRKEGQYWKIVFSGKLVTIKHMKGLWYLSALLRDPGRDFRADDLRAAIDGQPGPVRSSAGEVADPKSIEAYKARAVEIHSEMQEARRNNDLGRIERLQNDFDLIADQVTAATGLGGRTRLVGDTGERSRKAVGEAVKRAIDNIRKEHLAS
ncbi:MAG: hypothetical protein ABIZ80_01100 [Bryobacteraceae bacterium]